MQQGIHVLKIKLKSAGFIILFIFLLQGICLAHKVNIFAYTEGQKVYTESYFNDGRKCQGSQILVFDTNGEQILEGKTNKKGEFSFISPVKADLKIVLNATMGHKNECTVRAEDFEDFDEQQETPSSDKEISGIGQEEIISIIEEVLDRKLAPIIRIYAKEKADRGILFSDIIDGIGYIFGLMGVVFFVSQKREIKRIE